MINEKPYKSDLKDKYFARTEKWDWLTKERIHVFDSKTPRIISMDLWPQMIYIDAIGDITIGDYIDEFASRYPKGKVPEDLDDIILKTIQDLYQEEDILKISENPIELEESILYSVTRKEGHVNLLGVWKGNYTYNLPEEHKDEKTELVEFTITIDRVKGKRFFGTVRDNLDTGGTPGLGEIRGKYNNDKIRFYKNMPYYTIINERGEHITDELKKHPTIVYRGDFSLNKNHIAGNWEFKKKRIYWQGIIPFLYSFNGGFIMSKDEKTNPNK